MQRNLDIGTLRSLITVIDMAGITKAANKLNLTQSTVSMQIKRLEETLDTTLLQRDGRTMKPTREAEQLLNYAKKLVAINDDAIDRLTNINHGGTVRIGVPTDLAHTYVPEALKRFVNDYPEVTVSFTIDDTPILLECFKDGKLDLILTTEFGVGDNGQCLMSRNLVWTGALGGNAWKRSPVPIAFVGECMFYKPVTDALESAGIEWVDALTVNPHRFDLSSIAVAADLGIRADIEGFSAPGTAPIPFTTKGTRLPTLPRYQINAYVTDGPNKGIADVFVRSVQALFSDTSKPRLYEDIAV